MSHAYMFDAAKQQIREYLPREMSPFAQALVVGGITFVLTGTLLFFELLRPGITTTLPDLVMNMLILSAATLLTGIVAWLLQMRTEKRQPTKPLPRFDKLEQTNNRKKTSHSIDHFNYKIVSQSSSLRLESKTRAIYRNETTFITTGDITNPPVLRYAPLEGRAKIRMRKMNGLRPIRGETIKKLKKWSNEIMLELDHDGPAERNSKQSCSIEFEMKGRLLPHIYSYITYPFLGSAQFTIDVSKLSEKPRLAKLYEFISLRAQKPLKNTSDTPYKHFNNYGLLHWEIPKPNFQHLYVISWKEPCDCAWCGRINFR